MTDDNSPMIGSDRSLARYLRDIHAFPMLTPEEELMLARRCRRHGDVAAADRLVTSHLRLVVKIVKRYRGYGLPLKDLISEGNLGLIEAVKRFDPERGFRLTTYAIWWIRAAIQEYVLRGWSLVKMGTTGAQKRLFFNLGKLKREMQAIDEGDLACEMVAKMATRLGVAKAEIISMNRRLAGPDLSLNAPLRQEGDGEWQDWLVDDAESQESALAEREQLGMRRKFLRDAMRGLDAREREILTERRLRETPTPLTELSLRHKISAERVRQIEVRALEKLQRAVRTTALAA
ncbi:MAG TPA: RNA polymerase sigma factor RpoH [Stellaceae bacterium]|nr:RNA polymerase sigma factor RpoH [Stellaceae bacterium]